MMRAISLAVCFAISIGFASEVGAETWYVKPDGTGDAATIQDAIDVAGDTDVVLLAAGVFTGVGNRDIDFLGKAITVTSESGGANTIIDCQNLATGFTFQSGEGPGSILSDVTVTNANGGAGGAISVLDGSPTIQNNALHNNTAPVGGGIYVAEGSAATLAGNSITMNTATVQGGGVFCAAGALPQIIGNVVSENVAHGGTFTSGCGAGIYCQEGSTPTISENIISGNQCTATGLGPPGGAGIAIVRSPAVIIGNTFTENKAELGSGGALGGAIFVLDASPTISMNTFVQNEARIGSAIGLQGTFLGPTGEPVVEFNLFWGNSGATVLHASIDHTTVRNCTFAYNDGAAIHVGGAVALENSIVAFNTGAGVVCPNPGPALTASCNNLFGNENNVLCGIDGGGNFSADPRFCAGPTSGDFHIMSSSPCAPGNNDCGVLIGALPVACGTATLDIKPGSCPNPFNIKPFATNPPNPRSMKGGVLPVAILGTDNFDVSDINISTLLLAGVAPIRHGFADASRPLPPNGDECECTTGSPDGFTDLTLKFKKAEIAAALGPAFGGDVIELCITGELNDGTEFEACDCIVIRSKIQPPALAMADSDDPILRPAWPNPFNPTTTIGYVLPREMKVTITVHDVAGRLIARLVDGVRTAGEHSIVWDASGVASGVYFYRLMSGNAIETRRIVLLK